VYFFQNSKKLTRIFDQRVSSQIKNLEWHFDASGKARCIKVILQHQLNLFQEKSGMVQAIKQSKSSSGLIFEIDTKKRGRGREGVSCLSLVRKLTIARYS